MLGRCSETENTISYHRQIRNDPYPPSHPLVTFVYKALNFRGHPAICNRGHFSVARSTRLQLSVVLSPPESSQTFYCDPDPDLSLFQHATTF